MTSSDPIKEFFAGKEVFVTGGTGIVGKALVEKLLRSCPGITKLYVLIRDKKGKGSEERMKDLKNHVLFEKLRRENPAALEKLVGIHGDIELIDLGLSDKDVEILKNVKIVFHAAATIRFDEPLRKAILINVRGTQEVLRLAEKLPKLDIFLHVSTTYSNPYESHVKEELYPPMESWSDYIKYAEKFDGDVLNLFTQKLLGKFPNTYTLTKHLGEYVVNDFRGKFPVVIYRPSIVINTIFEPLPSWFEGFIGPVGLMSAIGAGIIRVMYCEPKLILDLLPLDLSIKTLIVTAWIDSSLPHFNMEENVRVYNSATSRYVNCRLTEWYDASFAELETRAFNKTIWYPRVEITKNKLWYCIQFFWLHLIPAILIDGLLKIFGYTPFMLKIYRLTLANQRALSFFLFNTYKFDDTRLSSLLEEIEQYEDFRYDGFVNKSPHEYARALLFAARKFILKEDDESIPSANFRFKMLKYADRIVRGLFFLWLGSVLFNYLSFGINFVATKYLT